MPKVHYRLSLGHGICGRQGKTSVYKGDVTCRICKQMLSHKDNKYGFNWR